MENKTIYHNIPYIAFTILEFVGCASISFSLGICYERTCGRRRSVNLD